MTSNPWFVVGATIGLIVLSALFVAAEFALLAAKRHRLLEKAEHSAAARAAIRSFDELTVLLAGSQLGITACALGLGAITKPALDYALRPVLLDAGLPGWGAGVLAFMLALLVVTFLHLVVGEMAPKSWAIAHPETAATLLALPMRGFMFVFRPILVALNEMANGLLRLVKVEPQDAPSTGQNPDDLRQLVEHSADVGALDRRYFSSLSEALDLQRLTVADLVGRAGGATPTAVGERASMADVRTATRESGHLRVLVRSAAESGGADGEVVGVVHVRDTMTRPADGVVTDAMRPAFEIDATTPVHEALTAMRETRHHLAVVHHEGQVRVLTMADVLDRLLLTEIDAAPDRDPQPAE